MIEKRFVIHDPSAWPLDSRVIQSHHSKLGSTPQRHSIGQTPGTRVRRSPWGFIARSLAVHFIKSSLHGVLRERSNCLVTFFFYPNKSVLILSYILALSFPPCIPPVSVCVKQSGVSLIHNERRVEKVKTSDTSCWWTVKREHLARETSTL